MKKLSLLLALIMLLSCGMFACETETNNKQDEESSKISEESGFENANSNKTSSEDTEIAVDTNSDEYNQAMDLIEQGKYEDAYTLIYSVHKTDKSCAELMKDFKVVYSKHTRKGTGFCGDYEYIETSVYTYDCTGNLLQNVYSLDSIYTDEIITEISTTSYIYDEGKLIKEEQGESDLYLYITEYFYNSEGVLLKKISTSYEEYIETTEYFYDSNGILLKEVYDQPSGKVETAYTYDSEGRFLKMVETDDNGEVVFEYTYDPDGKILKEVNDVYGHVSITDYIYDEDGKLLKKLCPDGDYVSVEYTYDSNGNITKEVSVDFVGSIETIEYSGYQYFYCPQK